MDNPETQDASVKTEGTIKNGQSRDTGNKRERTPNDNQEWTIKRHRKYWAHDTERRQAKQLNKTQHGKPKKDEPHGPHKKNGNNSQ